MPENISIDTVDPRTLEGSGIRVKEAYLTDHNDNRIGEVVVTERAAWRLELKNVLG